MRFASGRCLCEQIVAIVPWWMTRLVATAEECQKMTQTAKMPGISMLNLPARPTFGARKGVWGGRVLRLPLIKGRAARLLAEIVQRRISPALAKCDILDICYECVQKITTTNNNFTDRIRRWGGDMARFIDKRDGDDSLAVRAAWLHYAAGLTQSEVANRLGITSVKAHRLIARANQNGAVKVTIEGDIAECVMLERQLEARYGLEYSEVVPDLHEQGLPLKALGMAGGGFLQREIENFRGGVIGIGHGRTLAAAVNEMARMDAARVRFVSLLGGVTRNYAANPHDVMHRLTEKTGAAAFVLPVPVFANSVEDREVLLAQRGVGEVFELAARADPMIVGIGTAEPDAQLVASHMIEPAEIREVRDLGGVGEMLGYFFDSEGKRIETSLSARTLSPGLDGMRGRRIVAIAGGIQKIAAIRALLKSGFLRGLITDERTAQALVNEDVEWVRE
jgi:DNA-binding transcriptional regulator LsrR (DeoR family)